MGLRTLFILLVCFTLFSYQCKKSQVERPTFSRKHELPKILKIKVQQHLQNGQQGALENSLNLGARKGLDNKIYQQFKSLNLLHLFTPSGLHYFPIFWILRFIFSYKVLRIYAVIFWIFCLSLDGFYSLKRIAAIKMLWLFRKYIPWELDLYKITLIVFLCDLILGSFFLAPLSWGYSFLFLGILSTGSSTSFFKKIGIGQLFISLFEGFSFNFISFASGYFISLLVSFVFPIVFFNYWAPWSDPLGINHALMNLLLKMVGFSSLISSKIQTFNTILFIFLILNIKKKNKKLLALNVFLL